ncbi:hypothetical protein [Nocardioides lianchengensis]|uniref:Secreted protein n=1 Tax=Nocardioides lianchengensis TaxID=1045774 RepID=A0A1G6S3K7_9ACTN|nr:hypothetical protein [Nocardioides lianchengensis]SDD11502.1 hypothetical protein SAMN05421872_1067 [Nocardioides lianchengensis]
MRALRPLAVLSATAAVIALGIGPAAANDIQFSFHGASARYTDATDTLCAKAVNDTGAGLEDYAYALIQNASGGTVASSPFASQGQGWRCTGNLSIPEDRLYTLVLFDCTRIPGTDCGGTTRQFYS